MVHLPILRQGVPYKSLDGVTVPHFQQHADEALAAAADA